ncbi:MAG TPA: SdrD B-like domain-containing protein [Bryobacteraceae bacterium]|nr:SdrD B-like domain-containing protein [Bryobacteraceae bacterium]
MSNRTLYVYSKFKLLAVSALICSAMALPAAAQPVLNLPPSVSITQIQTPSANLAAPSFLTVTLSGIGGGFDLSNGSYRGWCGDIYSSFVASTTNVIPYSVYSPTLPANIQSPAWRKVNYVLNHRQGTWRDVQRAIWILLRGVANPTFAATPESNAMVNDANAFGASFVPAYGQVIAVLLYQNGFSALGSREVQDTFIEVPVTQQDQPSYELGNLVWNDTNRNGIQDAGEPGINGVTIKMTKPDATVVTTTTANVNGVDGIYGFSGLAAGQYIVEVDGSSPALADMQTTLPAVGVDRSVDSNAIPTSTTLDINNTKDLTLDFGYSEVCNASVGDFVWLDVNRDGIQDIGEPGIAGVTVQLFNTLGALITTRTTDQNGFYSFTGLCGGTYKVGVLASTAPAGVKPTTTGAGSTATDSNPNPSLVTLSSNSKDVTYDFGFRGGVGCTYTQGFWKNHAKGKKSAWPVTSIALGSQVYSMDDILDLWDMPVTGNATINLAHQLFATKLNLYNDASLGTNAGILAWVAQAETLINNRRLPFTVDSATAAQMLAVKTQLDEYNNGRFPGTAHCD